MSSSIALRRSPKPGALTAATLRPPRSLLTTRVAKRLALDVLGDDQQRLARLHDRFEHRQEACRLESFFSWIRMYGSSRVQRIFSASVMK